MTWAAMRLPSERFIVASIVFLLLLVATASLCRLSPHQPFKLSQKQGFPTMALESHENSTDMSIVLGCLREKARKSAQSGMGREGSNQCWGEYLSSSFSKVVDEFLALSDGELQTFLQAGRGWDMYNLIPTTYMCDPNHLARRPAIGDGGKWICVVPKTEPCIIYSLGSNGDFSFEDAMHAESGGKCQIWTFDCTSTEPPATHSYINFRPWCLSDVDNAGVTYGRIYKTFESIVTELGHNAVDILKMDIEGGEHQVFRTLLKNPVVLPTQIAVEMHFYGSLLYNTRQVLEYYKSWRKLGYHVVIKEHNVLCTACTEFLLVHASQLHQD
ncbi:hypothetical protein M427DRAFT_472686 [Gonapodya prolifera JEL478]|uniref:Methyltransferase domain-containing protein n=1 Tax=Gonapodya prolifera (strain JEL478) TaxID=1344416 RepID=A0A139AS13_GONPJ|nr:hypothetical protein M427DRAFT_472686 [Gonapodya prolifera JEL478]|eukprot:KXS19255.1 hypothetical protein M427DRAFT_472686 [Gonapodya prolifera JEL478]